MSESVWYFNIGYIVYPGEGDVTVEVNEQLINDLEDNGVLVIRGDALYKSDEDALNHGVLPNQYYGLAGDNEIGISAANGGVPKQLLDYPMSMSLNETQDITMPSIIPIYSNDVERQIAFANIPSIKRKSIFIRIYEYIKNLFYATK